MGEHQLVVDPLSYFLLQPVLPFTKISKCTLRINKLIKRIRIKKSTSEYLLELWHLLDLIPLMDVSKSGIGILIIYCLFKNICNLLL